jgi:hypothetical protein
LVPSAVHFDIQKERIMNQSRFATVLSLAACFVAAPSLAQAQEKDVVIEGQVKAGIHKFKLDNSTLYQIEVKGKNFLPNVYLQGTYMPSTIPFGKEPNTFRGLVFPPKSAEYTLTILPNVGFDLTAGLLDYTVTLKTMKLDETPLLKKEDKLTADDPKYANPQAFNRTHHKAYPIKMKAGQLYIIDMVAKKADGNKVDPYLHLEAPNKNILARDDDGGGYPNARIIYRATADGEHQIIAGGLNDVSAIGEYALTVRTVKTEK